MTNENENDLGKSVSDWLNSRTWLERFIDNTDDQSRKEVLDEIGPKMPHADAFLAHLSETSKKVFGRELDDLNDEERLAAWGVAEVNRPDLFESLKDEACRHHNSSNSS